MRKTILALGVLLAAGIATAGDVYVDGYTRRDGTYVEGYHRSSPDRRIDNNYGTRGNYNPYTGQAGTESLDREAPVYRPAPTYQPFGGAYEPFDRTSSHGR